MSDVKVGHPDPEGPAKICLGPKAVVSFPPSDSERNTRRCPGALWAWPFLSDEDDSLVRA